jgi:hypothetical protein
VDQADGTASALPMKSTDELKFLLILLGCANYRSPLSASRFKRFKNKKKICQDLRDRELVDFSREIATVKILPAGSALLKLDPAQLPISSTELKVLEKIASAASKITPAEIKELKSLKADEKQAILNSLSDRGLIEAETQIKKTKAEVWLTQRGIEYLRDDYTPKGSAQIQLDLLNNYLRFLRKSLRTESAQGVEERLIEPESHLNSAQGVEERLIEPEGHLNDDEVLQIIRKLDQEHRTENYLPIFYLRDRVKPQLSREQLDQVLYRLQRHNKIELSSLQEAIAYTPEQIDAGIPQEIGGPLFFISVN